MRLSDYLNQLDVTDEDFGRKVGRDRSSIYRLKNGQQKPSAELLQSILDATAGAVTPNDFFDVPDEAPAA
jgi:transcriptional regulator with XRE-family HTH domain